MAGHSRYTAVLDACVLYPAPLRDLLISLAVDGLYRARWTSEIQDEDLATLEQQGLPQTCQILRNAIDLI